MRTCLHVVYPTKTMLSSHVSVMLPRQWWVVELAEATGAYADNLNRILRVLAMRGVFRENDHGRIELTAEADLLRTDVPGSLRSAVLTFTDKTFKASHGELAESLHNGTPSFDKVFGTSFFEYFRDVESPETFYAGMRSKSDSENASIIRITPNMVGANGLSALGAP
jgi:hypothetical protein